MSSVEAVGALRAARRANRIATIDWFEALYRAYVTGLFLGIGLIVLAGVVGGQQAGAASLARVVRRGPGALGLVAAVGLYLAARSGSRGGPLAFEQADIRHLLLAPVAREQVIRPVALRQLRSGALAGVCIGAVSGLFASHRLPGPAAAWVLTGALFGVGVIVAALGMAMVVSGTRLGRFPAGTIGAIVIAWSAADMATGRTTSPLTGLGRLALAPGLHAKAMTGLGRFGPAPSAPANALAVGAGVLVVAGLAAAGVTLAHRLSIEGAERRTKLVGELRFAATLRDVRTVLVLQRQLSQDRPRSTPWIRLPLRGRSRLPVWRRGWRGVLRWRATRVLRVAVLGAVAGAAVAVAARGTWVLLVVAGAALWVAALDCTESLAQELDHPSLFESYPLDRGRLFIQHLPLPIVLALMPSATAVATAVLIDKPSLGPATFAVLAVSAAVTAACGATITIVKGPPPPFTPNDLLMPPEIAAIRKFQQLVFPLIVAGAGLVGLVVIAHTAGRPPSPTAPPPAGFSVFAASMVAMLTIAWLLSRDRLVAQWRAIT